MVFVEATIRKAESFIAIIERTCLQSLSCPHTRRGAKGMKERLYTACLAACYSTLSSAIEALRRAQPCLAGALVISNPSAVDSALLRRLAGVAYQNYSCLALWWQRPCPVFYL